MLVPTVGTAKARQLRTPVRRCRAKTAKVRGKKQEAAQTRNSYFLLLSSSFLLLTSYFFP
jgi:hypothetical protein